jgi:GDP-D-mannose dehydratase
MFGQLISETNYDGKIIFCTGLTGFIGTNLYHRLAPKGIHFISLIPAKEPDHMHIFENATFYDGRIEDMVLLQSILSTHQPHYIIHLAAKSAVQSSFQWPKPMLVVPGISWSQLGLYLHESGVSCLVQLTKFMGKA